VAGNCSERELAWDSFGKYFFLAMAEGYKEKRNTDGGRGERTTLTPSVNDSNAKKKKEENHLPSVRKKNESVARHQDICNTTRN